MKKLNVFLCGFVALALLLVVSTPSAKAQLLDDVWFKMKVSAKGYLVDPVTGDYSKKNLSGKFYMHFVYNAGSYDIDVYTETAPGTWTNSYSTSESTIAANENFFSDFYLELYGEGGDYIEIYHTPFIKIKTDGAGAFAKATYNGVGEVLYGEFDGGAQEYYGYAKIKGKSKDASKLPFTP